MLTGTGLRAEGLTVLRGERLVLRDLSAAVAPGGALLLHGPNGAGKSSLLRALAGLLRPEAGSVEWDGEPIAADPVSHAGRMRFLGHSDGLRAALTPEEALLDDARLGGAAVVEAQAAAVAALARLGLGRLGRLPVGQLSQGQRRRVALARLLLAPRPLWLLDEPSVGLDQASVEALGPILAEHRALGGIVVAASHLPLPLERAEILRFGAS